MIPFENEFNEDLSLASYVTVSYNHVTDAFQSESKFYSYLNVKEVLARNTQNI